MERRTADPPRTVFPRRAAAPRAAVLAMLAVALPGCGDDDPSDITPIEAAYEMEISGAVTEQATGKAYFGSDEDELGQPVFALLLGDDTSRHLVMAGKDGATRPAAGQYAIVDPEQTQSGWSLLHLISEGDELLGMFVASQGTLTITESTADVLRGTLEFDAVGVMGMAEDSVAVTASFVAVPATEIGVATSVARAAHPAGTR